MQLHTELEEIGIHIKRETLVKYIQILIDAKIVYECKRFDMKSKKSVRGEQKYYLSDLSFYFANNVDNRIHYGPVLENEVSVGRIGKLQCDFILRDIQMNYAYVQVAMTIMSSEKTEEREYTPLESIKDGYPKYLLTRDDLIQKRNGVKHVNIPLFIQNKELFI